MTTILRSSREQMLDHARSIMGAALVAHSRVVTEDVAREVLRNRYGMDGLIKPLTGEKDRNFYVCSNDNEYVLKFVHELEPRDTSNLHTEAMLHLERTNPGLPVQRVARSLDGETEFEVTVDGVSRLVRLVTFIPGRIQRSAPSSRRQRFNIGQSLARLLKALESFRHPAENHRLIWDAKHAADLRSLTDSVDQERYRSLLNRELDRFKAEILPALTSLRSQAIHNDLNGDNIVVAETDLSRVTGILDFGDLVRTPLVIDVAVAATYQLSSSSDPLAGALDLIGGFHSVHRLDSNEIDLLFDLILIRIVARIVITGLRAAFFPENREYILRNTDLALTQFTTLIDMDRRMAVDAIRRSCEECERFS